MKRCIVDDCQKECLELGVCCYVCKQSLCYRHAWDQDAKHRCVAPATMPVEAPTNLLCSTCNGPAEQKVYCGFCNFSALRCNQHAADMDAHRGGACVATLSVSGFTKFSKGKRRMGLLPPRAIELVADVLTMGAKKYSPDNWAKAPSWSTYYDAMQRHLSSWWGGQDLDPESGKSHLAHAACCVLFLMEFERRKISVDDRQKDI
jgi:predicted peroxiredoxin